MDTTLLVQIGVGLACALGAGIAIGIQIGKNEMIEIINAERAQKQNTNLWMGLFEEAADEDGKEA